MPNILTEWFFWEIFVLKADLVPPEKSYYLLNFQVFLRSNLSGDLRIHLKIMVGTSLNHLSCHIWGHRLSNGKITLSTKLAFPNAGFPPISHSLVEMKKKTCRQLKLLSWDQNNVIYCVCCVLLVGQKYCGSLIENWIVNARIFFARRFHNPILGPYKMAEIVLKSHFHKTSECNKW